MSDPNILEKSDIELFTAIQGRHMHPVETAFAPDMTGRRASASFTTAANTETFTLTGVVYTFVAALGSPAAGNVHVKVQGTVKATIQKLAEAIRGIVDADNIAYAAGEGANPTSTAYFTSQRMSVGTTNVPAGNNLFILEKAEDAQGALAISTTAAGGSVNAFIRSAALRYILDGNNANANLSIRGSMHCVLPLGSIVLGGQAAPGGLVYYDVHQMIMTGQSTATLKEVDIYMSADEVTFTRVSRSNTISDPSTNPKLHAEVQVKGHRIPKGYGVYIRVGSEGTNPANTVDLKFGYHLYPVILSR